MEQLLLDIQTQNQENPAESFLPLSGSFHAHQIALSSLYSEFSGCLILGPSGSGKSHLLMVCKQYLEDIAKDEMLYISNVENLSNVNENIKYLLIDNVLNLSTEIQEKLFHWFNHITEKKGKMIIAFETDFEKIVTLPDLQSRLLTMQQAILNNPNEKDLEIFIMKQAFDRQLQVGEDVLNYLSLRVDRDFSKIVLLMEKLDKESLREHRKITVPFIKKFI